VKRIAHIVAAALALIGLVAVGTGDAGAQADAQVTIVDASTYSASEPFPQELCIDNVPQTVEAGDIIGPEAYTPGTYAFTFGGDCNDPNVAEDLVFAAGDDVTVLLYWGQNFGITVLDNDTSCPPAGEGRLTVRNGTTTNNGDPTLESGGDPLVPAVAEGSQQSVELAAGTVDDVTVTGFPGFVDGTDLGDLTIVEGETLVLYLAGGTDGDLLVFDQTIPLACDQPTTTTTTVVAEPVTPVAVAQRLTPAFTG
jgi:hypothetical protein